MAHTIPKTHSNIENKNWTLGMAWRLVAGMSYAAHENFFRLNGASAILIMADGRLLLQKRDAKATNPNVITPFGGGAEPEDGNDPHACLRRELKQELEIEIKAPLLVRADCMAGRGINYVYLVSGVTEIPACHEGAPVFFDTVDEVLANKNTGPWMRETLQMAREKIAGIQKLISTRPAWQCDRYTRLAAE